jgi:hypothetical protein
MKVHTYATKQQHIIKVSLEYYNGWLGQLGQINLVLSMQLMSRFSHMPREGHFDAVMKVFSYLLKGRLNSKLVVDPVKQHFPKEQFVECDWSEQYLNAMDETPPRMPTLLSMIACFSKSS